MLQPTWPTPHYEVTELKQFCVLAIGTVFNATVCPVLLLLYLTFTNTLQTWGWQEAVCELKSTRVDTTPGLPGSVQLFAEVEFELNGSRFTATSPKATGRTYGDSRSGVLAARYPSGIFARCLVDPLDPSSFVLHNDREKALGLIWIALVSSLALLLCLGPRWGALRHYVGKRLGREPAVILAGAAARPAAVRRQTVCLYVLPSLAILAIHSGMEGSRFLTEKQAGGWSPESCTVAFSTLGVSAQGATDEDFIYEFFAEGRRYRAEGPNPTESSLPSKLALELEMLGEGDSFDCWVSRDRPFWARLDPPGSSGNWFRGSKKSLVFFVVCLVLAGWSQKRRFPELSVDESSDPRQRKFPQWFPRHYRARDCNRGNLAVDTKGAARRSLRPTAVLSLFGISMLLLFGWAAFTGIVEGIVIGAILVLMPVIGWSIFGMFKERSDAVRALSPCTPKLRVDFGVSRLFPGCSGDLRWRIEGGRNRYNSLEMVLRAKERYLKRASDTKSFDLADDEAKDNTDNWLAEQEIYSERLLLEDRLQQLDSGTASFAIPPGLPHSLMAPHFGVLWSLEVRADIGSGMQRLVVFDLEVYPGGGGHE